MIRLEKSWQTHADIVGKTVEVDERERTVTSIITTDRVDSDKEIVVPKGLDLKRHNKNPVVFFMHDAKVVVGKSLWKKLISNDREMLSKTQFAELDFADEVYQLVKGDFIRGWSVGMDPATAQVRDVTEKDCRRRPDWTGARSMVVKAELLEYSVATIPANPDALNRAHDEGLIKFTKQYLPCGVVVTADEADDPPTVVRVDKPIVRIAAPVKMIAPTVSVPRMNKREAEAYVNESLRHVRGLT